MFEVIIPAMGDYPASLNPAPQNCAEQGTVEAAKGQFLAVEDFTNVEGQENQPAKAGSRFWTPKKRVALVAVIVTALVIAGGLLAMHYAGPGIGKSFEIAGSQIAKGFSAFGNMVKNAWNAKYTLTGGQLAAVAGVGAGVAGVAVGTVVAIRSSDRRVEAYKAAALAEIESQYAEFDHNE